MGLATAGCRVHLVRTAHLPHGVSPMSLTKSLTQPLPKRLTRSLLGDGGGDAPVPEVPPYITLQPIAVAVPVGDTFMLEMDADGIEPITFKWQRRTMGTWVDIPGATGKTYTVASASLADTGQYRGVASNLHGDSSTNAVLVEVLQAPVFTLQPAAFSDLYGEPISFTVDTEGYPAVTYQWYFKPEGGSFAALPGETAATLDLGLFDFGKVGEYYVAATNSQGTTNSNTVAAVFTGITITQQPVPMVIDHEDTISLSVAADSVHPVTYQWFKVHTWYPDVTSYLTRVEAEDGQSLEPAVALAWDAFFRAMADPDHPTPTAATHRIALAEGTMIPMLGARTLAGCQIPAYAGMPSPTNVGIVTGDYDRVLGIQFDGATKYIDLGVRSDDLPLDDVSQGVHITAEASSGIRAMIGYGGTGITGSTRIARHSSISTTASARSRSSTVNNATGRMAVGVVATSRAQDDEYDILGGGGTSTPSSTSQSPAPGIPVLVGASGTDNGAINHSDHRSTVAWHCLSVDLDYMDSCLTTLQSSIAAALA